MIPNKIDSRVIMAEYNAPNASRGNTVRPMSPREYHDHAENFNMGLAAGFGTFFGLNNARRELSGLERLIPLKTLFKPENLKTVASHIVTETIVLAGLFFAIDFVMNKIFKTSKKQEQLYNQSQNPVHIKVAAIQNGIHNNKGCCQNCQTPEDAEFLKLCKEVEELKQSEAVKS